MIEDEFSFASISDAGVIPYFLPSSLDVCGVEHFKYDNVDNEGTDCPVSSA